MEGMIGEIRWFAGNFAPKSWAFCNGQTVNISSNTALFSILGTTYGGNGTTNFQLPNFQSRVPVGAGQGPGLSLYSLGQVGGSETVTMTVQQMPSHVHMGTVTLNGTEEDANAPEPSTRVFATSAMNYYGPGTAGGAMKPFNVTVQNSGGSQAIYIEKPSLGMNFIICQYGVFPSRN
jgi:microcystin-dependent protein